MNKNIEKIVSGIKKKYWYIILLTSSTAYVLYYKNDISELKELNSRNLIFILWLVILLLPLFSEMEFFGIKLKKEVEKARFETKESINELRLQIQDLKITNSNSSNIYFGDPPLAPKQKLEEMKRDNKADADIKGADMNFAKIAFEVSDDSVFLFKVRLMLENDLFNLCETTGYTGPKNIHNFIRHLTSFEFMNARTRELIEQILAICNRGVHGELISKEYLDFIKEVLPDIKYQFLKMNLRIKDIKKPDVEY